MSADKVEARSKREIVEQYVNEQLAIMQRHGYVTPGRPTLREYKSMVDGSEQSKRYEYVRLIVDWNDLSQLNNLSGDGWRVAYGSDTEDGFIALLERPQVDLETDAAGSEPPDPSPTPWNHNTWGFYCDYCHTFFDLVKDGRVETHEGNTCTRFHAVCGKEARYIGYDRNTKKAEPNGG